MTDPWMSETDKAIRDGRINLDTERNGPQTNILTGRTYYGLPDAYPFNREGFAESQAESARWVAYEGPTEETIRWELAPGTKLELWPGGAIFNEYGTLVGWLNLCDPPEQEPTS